MAQLIKDKAIAVDTWKTLELARGRNAGNGRPARRRHHFPAACLAGTQDRDHLDLQAHRPAHPAR